VDLGSAPPSNAYLSTTDLRAPEKWYPLRVLVCDRCWLVQTEDYAGFEELFSAEYAYFSSYSSSWLKHAEEYVDAMVEHFTLNKDSLVVEVAANDGYLLQFVEDRGISCFGIEPTASTAAAAREKGIKIIEQFFGVSLAQELAAQEGSADLIAANNVLAHVPDINDFVSGFAHLLKPAGVATFEFPHLMRLVAGNQFDTIYHEHYSYLSLMAVDRIFTSNGLRIFDVEELATHGGSLRVYARRADADNTERSERLLGMLELEKQAGLGTIEYYQGFQPAADKVKNEFLRFLLEMKEQGLSVAAYGAAAKGNTLLNYAGIRPDLLSFVADRNPAKQGMYLPGSRIPIVDEERILTDRPDRVVILPWNLKLEIMEQLACLRDWGGKFVTAVPELTEVPW
jgi:SAM-dependent methyltransferase